MKPSRVATLAVVNLVVFLIAAEVVGIAADIPGDMPTPVALWRFMRSQRCHRRTH